MHSGIKSLATTHHQVIVAYTGDIHSHGTSPPSVVGGGAAAPGEEVIPLDSVTDEEKVALAKEMATYQDPDSAAGEAWGQGVSYVPVFLEDKTARGYYDGYCKNSESPDRQ